MPRKYQSKDNKNEQNKQVGIVRKPRKNMAKELDKKLKQPGLSDDEKLNLTRKRKDINDRAHLSSEQYQRQKDKEERLADIKENKDAHQGGEAIKRFTFNGVSNRLNKMVHGSTMSTYTNRLVHWITKGWGRSNTPLGAIPANTFHYSMNKIYTHDSVKLPLVITGWGSQLPLGWLDRIRGDLLDLQNRINIAQNVKISISLNHIMSCDPSDIQFKKNKRLENDYERAINSTEDIDDDDTGLLSYLWLQGMEMDDHDTLWEVNEFIELVVNGARSGDTAEILHEAYDVLNRRLKILDFNKKDLYLTVQNYYDEFGPLGHQDKKGEFAYLHKHYINQIRSGEQITAQADLRQGSISDPSGVPVGIDINSERPIFVNYADNNLPPSTVVSAATGAGKTYLMQTILIGLLNNPNVYFPIIIDYKNEYTDLGRSSGMQIISSSPVDGLYFDTMEIPEPTGHDDVDERAKDNSLITTENVFEILLGSNNWESMKPAFSFVRRQLYRRHHVLLDDSETWVNSRGLTYQSFYNEISNVLRQNRGQAQEIADENVYLRMQQILSDYFERDGDKSSYFKRPIRMTDINNHRGIVFALDRNGEMGQVGTHDTKLLLTMQFIMHILNNLTDKQDDKRLLPIFWEETNQLLLIPNIAAMISSITSGGRSRGIRNFFITNSPGQIFGAEKESKFSTVDPKLISAIISNAQSIIVGPNSQQDMDTIAERYQLNSQTLKGYMHLLAEQATNDNSDSSVMAHKFIIRHRGKAALIQAVSNQALDELNLFGTSLDLNRQKGTIEQQKAELLNRLYKDSNAQENANIQKQNSEINTKLQSERKDK